jgi:transcriptional regulator with XRE-family HTH domain
MAPISVPQHWYWVATDQGMAMSMIFRELMADLPMSHTELAEKLGVAQPTVSRWARGKTEPNLDLMVSTVEAVSERLAEQTKRAERARDVLAAVRRLMAAKGSARRKASDALDKVLGPELERAREAIDEAQEMLQE